MLFQFKFSNYRSFRDEAELSALATRLDEDVAVLEQVSRETRDTVKALPVVAVLGANASGKSNLIRAIFFLRALVFSSSIGRSPLGAPSRDPFRLDNESQDRPSMFEVDFSVEGERYVYGFELGTKAVTGEWLHTFPHRRTQILFDRDGDDFSFGRNLPGPNKRIADLTRSNALYLSTAASSNHEFLTKIFSWFYWGLNTLDLASEAHPIALAREVAGKERRISDMLRLADLGIVDARVERRTPTEAQRAALRESLEQDISKETPHREDWINRMLDQMLSNEREIQLIHRAQRGGIPLPFEEESLGTKTWLVMVIAVLKALEQGSTVVVDELDASLHPALMAEILRLFGNRRTNRKGAQLIFTTHDTWSLDTKSDQQLSRGQIWFVEKDRSGSSTLTPLSEYRPRKGENIERGYLQGRYGGVPRPESSRLLEVAATTPAPDAE